jgi:hypothetical protein
MAWWAAVKKHFVRLLVWFEIQQPAIRLTVLALIVLIPTAGIYSFKFIHNRAALAAQVGTMGSDGDAAQALHRLYR